jgi:hypothetical protein
MERSTSVTMINKAINMPKSVTAVSSCFIEIFFDGMVFPMAQKL